MKYYYKDDGIFKNIRSTDYNSRFNRKTGEFLRWGKTIKDDPNLCLFGPELLDIEIGSGECSGDCKFCYKSNGSGLENRYMTLDKFVKIFGEIPPTVNQIAFGITDIDLNPDFWSIMKHCRDNGVIPNFTCNGNNITRKVAELSSRLCGSVAVSLYDKNSCYNAVKQFVDAGVTQVNIHYMLAEETLDDVFSVINDIENDSRLEELYGLIFLQYKPHGRGINHFTPVRDLNKFAKIIEFAERKKVRFGFDSCTTPIYLKTIEKDEEFDNKVVFVEPCESGLFSLYANVDGEFFPCSFMEGERNWEIGVKIEDNFIAMWNGDRINRWRKRLLNSSKSCDCKLTVYCRSCPEFSAITVCKSEMIHLEVINGNI